MDESEISRLGRRDLFAVGGAVAGAVTGMFFAPAPASAAATVDSVNGKTGDVVLVPSDIGAFPQDHADQISVVATPDRFPGIDPTGASNSGPPLQAAINAVPDQGTLLIPPGTYSVGTPLSVPSGRTLRITAYGATFVHAVTGPMLSAVGEYDPPTTITQILTQSVAFPSGASAPVTVLNTASAPPWSQGDILKLVSDDEIPEARPGSGGSASRRGEFVTVGRTAGSQTFLSGVVRDQYATNVRAARITRQTLHCEGLTVETTSTGLQNGFGVSIIALGLYAPVFRDVRVRSASAIGLQLTSCLAYRVENMTVDMVAENLSNGQPGYGVLDNASSHGQIVGGSFRFVRHAYTDDTQRVASNSDIRFHGRTYGTRIVGASAAMTTNNSWDTHHSSEGVEFIGCSASGGVPRNDRGFAGFGLRGKNHRVVGCSANDMENGVSVYTEGAGGRSYGHVVSDFVARRAQNAALNASVNGDTHPAARTREALTTLYADGILAEDCNKLLYAMNASVRLRGATFIAPPGTNAVEYNAVTNRNSFLDLRDVTLDYGFNTAGKPQPFLAISSGAGWVPGTQDSVLSDVVIRGSVSVQARASRPLVGGSHRVKARGLVFTTSFAVMPGDRDSQSIIEWRCIADPGGAEQDQSSSYFYIGATDLDSPLVRVRQSPDANVAVKVNPSTGTYLTSTFLPGFLRGQVIYFWVQDNVSGVWRVPHGTEQGILLVGEQERSLRRSDQLRIIWDGTAWRELA